MLLLLHAVLDPRASFASNHPCASCQQRPCSTLRGLAAHACLSSRLLVLRERQASWPRAFRRKPPACAGGGLSCGVEEGLSAFCRLGWCFACRYSARGCGNKQEFAVTSVSHACLWQPCRLHTARSRRTCWRGFTSREHWIATR